MTAGVNCHSLSIAGVEVLDSNMEWKQVQKEFHIVESTQGSYYIRVSIDVHVFYSVSDDINNKFMWTQSQKRHLELFYCKITRNFCLFEITQRMK